MATNLTTVLLELLSVTTVASVATVLVCLASMVIFILRFNTDAFLQNFSPDPSPKLPVPRQDMVQVYNPFFVKLIPEKSSLSDGTVLLVSADTKCVLTSGWAVNTNALNELIKSRARVEHMFEDSEICRHSGDCQRLDPCAEKEIILKCPDSVDAEIVGETIPRTCYPLVVIVTAAADAHLSPTDHIIGLLSVFHLQDSFCQSPSHVIMQYLILSGGHLCRLEQLYSTAHKRLSTTTRPKQNAHKQKDKTEISNRPVDAEITHESGEPRGLATPKPLKTLTRRDSDVSHAECCVVCQTSDVSHVLLPCRHSCVCRACFGQVNKCPMCRANIRAYFVLDGSTYADETQTGGATHERVTWFDRLMRFNDTLNNLLEY